MPLSFKDRELRLLRSERIRMTSIMKIVVDSFKEIEKMQMFGEDESFPKHLIKQYGLHRYPHQAVMEQPGLSLLAQLEVADYQKYQRVMKTEEKLGNKIMQIRKKAKKAVKSYGLTELDYNFLYDNVRDIKEKVDTVIVDDTIAKLNRLVRLSDRDFIRLVKDLLSGYYEIFAY
jgi:hypothetical protein